MTKQIVVDIGHSASAPGACNERYEVCEYGFNSDLAERLESVCRVDMQIVRRGAGLTDLCRRINLIDPVFVLSLHCNGAAIETATGTEMLYWHKSQASKRAAEILQTRVVDALSLRDRGIKARKKGDRGALQLSRVAAPIVIAEPFFITNPDDFVAADRLKDRLVDAYAKSLEQIFDELK